MQPEFFIKHRNPSVSEYQSIRETTGWDMLDDDIVERSLKESLFGVCVLKGSELIGMGRVVGDGGIYFYIQDVIVHPGHKGKGIGKKIMQEIENYLQLNAPKNAFIGLMAAKGVMGFYEEFGYKKRPIEGQGMFRTVKRE